METKARFLSSVCSLWTRTFNFLASLINGNFNNQPYHQEGKNNQKTFNFLASLINGNPED